MILTKETDPVNGYHDFLQVLFWRLTDQTDEGRGFT